MSRLDRIEKLEHETADLQRQLAGMPVREGDTLGGDQGEANNLLVGNTTTTVAETDTTFAINNLQRLTEFGKSATAPLTVHNVASRSYASGELAWVIWNRDNSRWETFISQASSESITVPVEIRTDIKQLGDTTQNVWICNHDYSARILESSATDHLAHLRGVNGTGTVSTLTTRGTFGRATFVTNQGDNSLDLQLTTLDYLPYVILATATGNGSTSGATILSTYKADNQATTPASITLYDTGIPGSFVSGRTYVAVLHETTAANQRYDAIVALEDFRLIRGQAQGAVTSGTASFTIDNIDALTEFGLKPGASVTVFNTAAHSYADNDNVWAVYNRDLSRWENFTTLPSSEVPTLPVEIRANTKLFEDVLQNVWVCNHDYSARLAEAVTQDRTNSFVGIHGTGTLGTLTTRGSFGVATLVRNQDTGATELQITRLEWKPFIVLATANATGTGSVQGTVNRQFRTANAARNLLGDLTVQLNDTENLIQGGFVSGNQYYAVRDDVPAVPPALQNYRVISPFGAAHEEPTIPVEIRTNAKQIGDAVNDIWVCNLDYSARLATGTVNDPTQAFVGINGTGDLATLTTRGSFGKATLVRNQSTNATELQLIQLEYLPYVVLATASAAGTTNVSATVDRDFRFPNCAVANSGQTITLRDDDSLLDGGFENGKKYFAVRDDPVAATQVYRVVSPLGGGAPSLLQLVQTNTIAAATLSGNNIVPASGTGNRYTRPTTIGGNWNREAGTITIYNLGGDAIDDNSLVWVDEEGYIVSEYCTPPS